MKAIMDIQKKVKACITGVSGQTGSYLAEILLEKGIEVVGTLRRTSQPIDSNYKNLLDNPLFRTAYLDLADPHSIASVIEKEKPDFFFNFGASAFVPDSWDSPAYTMQVNAVSVIHILEAIRKHCPKCRFYEASSSEIFGDVQETPQTEKTRPSPRSIYGVSKNAAREIVKVYRESYGLFAVSGINFNHESERRQAFYVSRKITLEVARINQALKNNEPFAPIKLGNLESKRDWSHASDVAEGIFLMMQKDYPKDYICASGETHTVKEFVELAFQAAGIEGTWIGEKLNEYYVLPNYLADFAEFANHKLVEVDPKFFRPNDVNLLLGDPSLAKKELGWEPKISFKELVKLMVMNDIANLKENA